MGAIIADTSVWISFLNGSNDAATHELREAAFSAQLYICPVIIQEILQGIKDDSIFKLCKEQLVAVPMLKANMWDASTGSASIYRQLRKLGITVRKPNDCLIAWYAIAYDLSLLHSDRDFDLIAAHTPLKVISL